MSLYYVSLILNEQDYLVHCVSYTLTSLYILRYTVEQYKPCDHCKQPQEHK